MKKLISNNYPFLILFLLIILKEPIYKIFMNPIIEINTKCDYIIDKYNELLEFSNISLTYDIDYINTYIIYKDQYNFMNEITIRGGNDFDLKNNPVIYNNTLIGVIYKVTQNSSKVRLLTNKDSKISVKVNDEIGMLEYENDMLIMRNINSYSTISIGDKIYTSGLGNINGNIFIGVVKDIMIDSKNIEKKVVVDYNIDIKNISYVTILKEIIK